jgi:PAS domain S-box-containing protein
MINRLIRRLTVSRRIFGGFLFLVVLFALTFPFVLKDHQLLVERLGQVTNVDKKVDRLLLLGSKRIESSRVNLMRFLQDYLPSANQSLTDIAQAAKFLTEAEKIIIAQEQKASVRKVIESLSNYQSIVQQVDVLRGQGKTFEINRLVFAALKTGNDIGSHIEHIVEKNEARVQDENRMADSQFKKSLWTLISFYAGALILGLMLAALVGRSITRPVAELRNGAESFSQGQTDVSLTVSGTDELSLLADTFNQMAEKLHQSKIALQERAEALEKELSERMRAEKELQRYQANLEEMIENRTQELSETLQDLKESEQRQSDIIDFLPDPTFVIDNQGVVVAWNRAMENLTGVMRDQMMGKGNYEYALPFYGDRRPVLIDLVRNWDETKTDQYLELKKDGDRLEMESFYPHLGERGIYLSGTARVLFDADGNEMGAIESIRDVTETRRIQEALKESEARVTTILNAINTGIIVIHVESRTISDINPVASKMIGLSREEIIGKTCHQFICPREEQDCPIMDHGQKIDNAERILIAAEGREIQILKTVVPITLNGEKHLLESFVDISERKEAEAELQNKLKELERFNQLTIDREFRMIQLKEEINRLYEQLDKEKKYKIVS